MGNIGAPKIHCKYDELVDPRLLKPHPKNRNSHPKDQIERLGQILGYQGIRAPVVISKLSGCIVKGHGTTEAVISNGWDKIPVVYQDFADKDAEYAFVQSDNAIASWAELDLSGINLDLSELGPDFDVDLLGIKGFTIDGQNEGLCDEDEVPEKVDPKTKLGDLYKLGNHRLLCGDSTNIQHVERLMGGEKADLWIADPPFGVSYMDSLNAKNRGRDLNQAGKEIKSDTKTVDELCPFWRDTAVNAYLVTTDKASNYWCACQGSDKMMMMMMMMDEAGWNIRHELIWVKQQFVLGRSDYHYRHEPIIYGWKKKGSHNWYGDRKQDSVLEIDRPHKSDLHPTTKPVELFEKFFSNSTQQGQLVYESFGGSGTSIIASEKLGRRCNTMEISPSYCDVIVARWEKFTGKKAELING